LNTTTTLLIFFLLKHCSFNQTGRISLILKRTIHMWKSLKLRRIKLWTNSRHLVL